MDSINSIYTRPDRPVRIVQFGEGNFLRAFADWMIDKANECGAFNGNIAIIKPRAAGSLEAFRVQDNIYTVQLRGIIAGKPAAQNHVVRSVAAAINPYNDIASFRSLAVSDALRFVISNTTDAGIEFRADDPLPAQDELSLTFPGKLTQLLFMRYRHFRGNKNAGLIMLPVELIADNGDALRACVLKYCEAWRLEQGFVQWLNEACIFASTLVDRIVSGYPRDEAERIWGELGYKDLLLTVGEPFALWVIEDRHAIKDEFPLDKAGLPVIFTADIAPYRARKVRILNGAHTSSVLAAYLVGCRSVLDMMNDADMYRFLEHVLSEEIVPFVPLAADEARAFARSVLERFRNPFVKHQLISIALNSFSKWRARLLDSFRDSMARSRFPRRIAFSFAALLRFYMGEITPDGYMGTAPDGSRYKILDDARVIEAVSHACRLPAAEYVRAVMARADFWGEDLTHYEGFADYAADALERIISDGMRAAINSIK